MYYYGARYYNPRESVWLSADPLSGCNPNNETEHYIDGQHNGGVYNSFNLNTNIYFYHNPVKLVDPNGKQAYFQGMFNQSDMNALSAQAQYQQSQGKNWSMNTGNIHPVIRQMPERMEKIGDIAAKGGYLLTLTGAGAEMGIAIYGAGNVISFGGTGLGVFIDWYYGKYTEVGNTAAKAALIEGGQRLITSKIDKLPGVSEIKKEVLKQTVDMTVKAVDKAAAEISQSQNSNDSANVNKKTLNNP